ncbi:MAG: SpoIIE family protein phosphatase [Coriobacteriales bacterium]|nr:SpoIIE family protein phosphatase [Coriobacteriales bacterium]
MLASLLSLMWEAALVFDANGTIVLANDEAERLFGASESGLVDTNVRLLFMPPASMDLFNGPLETSLPFPLDGSTALVTDRNGALIQLRCERLRMPVATYLLVAYEGVELQETAEEHERLVGELSRANHRLSGTLRIVLSTLDSLDVGTLFSKILDEIAETMDAWACMAYVAEQSGYRLRGTTDSLAQVHVAPFIPYEHPFATLMAHEGGSVSLRVRPLTRDELRQGKATSRVLVSSAGESLEVSAATVPPFASFVLVPVWFGGHLIALLMVGWRNAMTVMREDIKLLDSVAEYLSVQLAGAFAALKAQHADRLVAQGSVLRERLLAEGGLTDDLLDEVFRDAAAEVTARYLPVEGNAHQRTTVVRLDEGVAMAAPLDLAGLAHSLSLPAVQDVDECEGLSAWLEKRGEYSSGVLVHMGKLAGVYRGALMVRDEEEGPFDEADLSFLRQLAEDVGEVAAGEQARAQDKRIAQALQWGMRNELQRVDGLSTQSSYTSATHAATVGGDFYDLVRLPRQKACAIMGDVSGKGVEAASVSSAVKTALGAYAWEGLQPARMVSLLNDFLLGFSRLETFATLFVGVVDLAAGVLTYCSAGHPPALLVRARTGELETLGVQSGVVGAFEGMHYADGRVRVEEGDILFLYTDGVTEARKPGGAFFGEDGLRDVVAREAAVGFEGLCDRVREAVYTFADNSLEDDVALVALRFDVVG